MDFLSHPSWSGISAIITFIALLAFLYADRERVFTLTIRSLIFLVLISVFAGFAFGMFLLLAVSYMPVLLHKWGIEVEGNFLRGATVGFYLSIIAALFASYFIYRLLILLALNLIPRSLHQEVKASEFYFFEGPTVFKSKVQLLTFLLGVFSASWLHSVIQ